MSSKGGELVHVNLGGSSMKCKCNCAEGGTCEHTFSGWRVFEGGNGGEQVCTRCGMGAMSHTLWTCWD